MIACNKPCSDCPFRKDSLRGWLSNYAPEELHRLIMNEAPFPCHMTHTGKSISLDEAGSDEYPLCAGALRYMKKGAKSPRNPEIAVHVKKLSMADCENILGITEFIFHHKPF